MRFWEPVSGLGFEYDGRPRKISRIRSAKSLILASMSNDYASIDFYIAPRYKRVMEYVRQKTFGFLLLLFVLGAAHSAKAESSTNNVPEQGDEMISTQKISPDVFNKLKNLRNRYEVLILRHPKLKSSLFLTLIADPHPIRKKPRGFGQRLFSGSGLVAVGAMSLGALAAAGIYPQLSFAGAVPGSLLNLPIIFAVDLLFLTPLPWLAAGAGGAAFLVGYWDTEPSVGTYPAVQTKQDESDAWMLTLMKCFQESDNESFKGDSYLKCAESESKNDEFIQKVKLSQSNLERAAAILIQNHGFEEVEFSSLRAEQPDSSREP